MRVNLHIITTFSFDCIKYIYIYCFLLFSPGLCSDSDCLAYIFFSSLFTTPLSFCHLQNFLLFFSSLIMCCIGSKRNPVKFHAKQTIRGSSLFSVTSSNLSISRLLFLSISGVSFLNQTLSCMISRVRPSLFLVSNFTWSHRIEPSRL